MPWRERPNPKALKQANDRLSSALLQTRAELEISERRRTGLEIVLTARLNRIAELNGKIDQLREQNKRLDRENENLAEMVKFTPPGNAAMSVPK